MRARRFLVRFVAKNILSSAWLRMQLAASVLGVERATASFPARAAAELRFCTATQILWPMCFNALIVFCLVVVG